MWDLEKMLRRESPHHRRTSTMIYYEVNGIHIMKRLLSSYMMAMEDYNRSVLTRMHYQTWLWLCNTAIGLPELVMGTGHLQANFCRPAPIPAKTHTHTYGCRFWWVPWVYKPLQVSTMGLLIIYFTLQITTYKQPHWLAFVARVGSIIVHCCYSICKT